MSEYINNPEEARSYINRYKTLHIFVFIIVGIFILRLTYLQVIIGKELRAFSEKNRIKQNKIVAPRGLIFDRDGYNLVENLPSYEAVVQPQYLDNPEEIAKIISPIINMTPERILERIKRGRRLNGPFRIVRIKENLSRDEVIRLKRIRFDLPGLEIRASILRYYPLNDNGAQLFGYVGEISKRELERRNQNLEPGQRRFVQGDIIGKIGIEDLLDNRIRGEDGVRFIQVDAHGRETITEIPNIYGEKIQDIDPVHGNHATLTIDRDIQNAAYDAFKTNDKIGSLIAMRPNGEILSWINMPSFNPNYFATEIPTKIWNEIINNPFKPLRNKAIQDHFSPGSTFKPFIALAALQEKVIGEHTVIHSPGRLRFGNRWYHNHNAAGEGDIEVKEAIERSSNVFFYQLGIKLGIDKMYNYLSLLGLGQKTGIEFPREVPGLLPSSQWKKATRGEEWQPGENLSVAIGQSYTNVTPLQMAVAYNTIATNGKVVKPFLIKKIESPEGQVVFEQSPQELRDITKPQPNGHHIDSKNFDIIKESMRRVANGSRGTARHWKVPGVQMAGKTGTAQVMNFSADQIYSSCMARPVQSRHHGWYIAWAPWDKPEIVVSVLTLHSCHGNTAAAPIVRDVVQAYFKKFHPDIIDNALEEERKRKVRIKKEVIVPDNEEVIESTNAEE